MKISWKRGGIGQSVGRKEFGEKTYGRSGKGCGSWSKGMQVWEPDGKAAAGILKRRTLERSETT